MLGCGLSTLHAQAPVVRWRILDTTSGTITQQTQSAGFVGINLIPKKSLEVGNTSACDPVTIRLTNRQNPLSVGKELGIIDFTSAFNSTSNFDSASASISFLAETAFTQDTTPTQIRFSTKQSKSTSLTPRMTIASNGHVGIGTTSPSQSLDVVGNFKVSGNIVLGVPTSNSDISGVTSETKSIEIAPSEDNGWGWRLTSVSGSNSSNERRFSIVALDPGYAQFRSVTPETHDSRKTTELFSVLPDGNVGIGTSVPNAKLAVNGTIKTKEVNVTTTSTEWPDNVFEKDYSLISPLELEKYISQNKHLPEVPSAAEVSKNGVNLGQMQSLLLKKIEELTLYLIEIKKENTELKNKVNNLEKMTERK